MKKQCLVLGWVCALGFTSAQAGEGDPDPSYGSSGIAKINAVPLLDQEPGEITKSVRGSGDRTYVIGTYVPNEGTKEQAYIARLLPNGSLDEEFAGGMTTVHFGEGSSFKPRDAVLTPEGGLLLAGPSSALESLQPTFCKLTPTGELDQSFGMVETPGCLVLDILSVDNNEGNPVMAISRAADGKYIAAFTVLTQNPSFIALTRLTADGAVDLTFGVNGFASFTDASPLEVHQVAVRPDGRIVAAGTIIFSPTDRDIVVVQIDEDGVENSIFTSQAIDLGNGPLIDIPMALALRENGEVVVAGSATVGNAGLAAVILRFDQALTPILPDDSQFPGTDIDQFRRAFILCDSCVRKRVTDIAVLGDGGLLMVGDYNFGADDEVFALRLNADWQLDTSFGLNGQSQFLGFNALESDTLDDVRPSLSLQCGDRPVVAVLHGENGANASIGAVRLLNGTIFCNDFED